jgi:NitT/TauT family transport system substrate-binding protein
MSEPMRSKNSKARSATALLAACLGLALGSPIATATERLRLVVTHTAPPLVPNSVMDLADTLGFYRREGLTVDFVRVQGTPLAIVALKTGNADLANISLSGALQLASQRVMKIKAVVSPDKAIRYLVASHRDVPSIKALEGFTLGIGGVGSLDHSMTRLVLAAHGVDVEKVKMVALGEPHVRALALSTRRIDATTMSVGTWSRFRDRPGLKVLLSDEDYFNAAPVLNKVIVAEQNVLAARGPAVERFVAALVKASRAFAADPGAWVEAMRHARPDVPRRELEELAHSFARHWSVNGGLDPAQVTYSIEQLYRQPEFRELRRVSTDELLDPGPLGLVLSRIGIIAGIDEPAQ